MANFMSQKRSQLGLAVDASKDATSNVNVAATFGERVDRWRVQYGENERFTRHVRDSSDALANPINLGGKLCVVINPAKLLQDLDMLRSEFCRSS